VSDLRGELEKIRVKHGTLKPKIVLKEATNPKHPLHNRFEWDDAKAGNMYRLQQAQELIASVRYRFTTPTGEERNIRRYYAVRATDADQYEYDDVEEAMQDAFRRKLILNEMQRRMDELAQQYGNLQEFWELLKKMAG
jgi:hypothetical protein